VAGILLWWRLGYVLLYNPTFYLNNPQKILAIYEGGMSFHGGIIGVILGLLWFSKYAKKPLLTVGDIVALTIPIWIFFGRIANYLNGELRGYTWYNGPFAMYYQGIWHFPSPLLEAILEWILLLLIMLVIQKKLPYRGMISGTFLMWYGLMRLFVEYGFRLPDVQIGYIANIFTLW
jgi:phosphatidylglycerol---prolipoprotein diacylglyceryl transferase